MDVRACIGIDTYHVFASDYFVSITHDEVAKRAADGASSTWLEFSGRWLMSGPMHAKPVLIDKNGKRS